MPGPFTDKTGACKHTFPDTPLAITPLYGDCNDITVTAVPDIHLTPDGRDAVFPVSMPRVSISSVVGGCSPTAGNIGGKLVAYWGLPFVNGFEFKPGELYKLITIQMRSPYDTCGNRIAGEDVDASGAGLGDPAYVEQDMLGPYTVFNVITQFRVNAGNLTFEYKQSELTIPTSWLTGNPVETDWLVAHTGIDCNVCPP